MLLQYLLDLVRDAAVEALDALMAEPLETPCPVRAAGAMQPVPPVAKGFRRPGRDGHEDAKAIMPRLHPDPSQNSVHHAMQGTYGITGTVTGSAFPDPEGRPAFRGAS